MSKKFGYVAAAALGAVTLVGATALPASAADTGDTTVTFTLGGGSLDITVPTGAALTDGAPGDASVFGVIGPVTASDTRGVTTGWVISAASTTFVDGAGSVSTSVNYSARPATATTGTVTPTTTGATPLTTTAVPVAAGTAASGNNTATFSPTLTVGLPADALAGDYTGTVTTSVA